MTDEAHEPVRAALSNADATVLVMLLIAFVLAANPHLDEARKHAKEQEEEERKRKAAEEEEERKRKAARAKNKAGKPFPGAKPPFGGDPDDDDAEAKRKAEEVRKAEEAAAAVGKIAKLEAELKTERDLRLKKEAEVEAANAFKYIPVATARLADILRKADEAPVTLAKADGKGTQSLGATVREVLGACNAAIEKSGVLHQNGSDFTGNIPGGARERLNAMASERITKAEGKETYEQAFAAVVRANPHLYTQYLKEEHSGRR